MTAVAHPAIHEVKVSLTTIVWRFDKNKMSGKIVGQCNGRSQDVVSLIAVANSQSVGVTFANSILNLCTEPAEVDYDLANAGLTGSPQVAFYQALAAHLNQRFREGVGQGPQSFAAPRSENYCDYRFASQCGSIRSPIRCVRNPSSGYRGPTSIIYSSARGTSAR